MIIDWVVMIWVFYGVNEGTVEGFLVCVTIYVYIAIVTLFLWGLVVCG